MFVGMRDVILRRMETPEPYAYLRRLGVDSMEVRIQPDLTLDAHEPVEGEKLSCAGAAACERVLAASAEAGVKVGAVLLNNRYHVRDLDAADENRWIAASADFARMAGLGVMRIDVKPDKTEGEEEFFERVAPALQEGLRVAADRGVGLAVENHGRFTNRREFMRRLLDRFAPLGLSVTLDTGNFYCTGGYPLSQVYDIVREFAPRVTHVHVKNISYPPEAREVEGHMGCEYSAHNCPIYEGDVDHARILAMLSDAGYKGGLYIEDESLGKFEPSGRVGIIDRTIEYLRGIAASLEPPG